MAAVPRGIRDVWSVRPEPRGPGHRAGMVLEPGRWAEFDPFLMMAEDWFRRGTFDLHPHRGIETVTYVLEGHLEHHDNQGGAGVLGPGDAQWMTAGRGVIHREEPVAGETVHSLQLWLNLPAAQKMTPPRYQDLRGAEMPVRREAGAAVRVFSGASGTAVAPTRNVVPVTMVELTLDADASVAQELPAGDNGFLYVVEGAGFFGARETPGERGQVLWLDPAPGADPNVVTVRANGALRALLFAGPPLREPVAAHGPFVMNTQAQIRQAFADYQAGRF